MKGFDDKALLLFPKPESYDLRDTNYKYDFKQAVSKLCDYLETIGISPHVFYSDDVARELDNGRFVYVNTLGRSDRYFTYRHCQGMLDAMSESHVNYDDIYAKYIDSSIDLRKLSIEERFELVLSRSAKATKDIIKSYRLVIHFKKQGNSQYTAVTKAGDGRILIEVNASNFVPATYMSGLQVHPVDILAVPYANKPLNKWGD